MTTDDDCWPDEPRLITHGSASAMFGEPGRIILSVRDEDVPLVEAALGTRLHQVRYTRPRSYTHVPRLAERPGDGAHE